MKPTLILLMLVGLVACTLAGFTQTSTTPSAPPPATDSAAATAAPAQPDKSSTDAAAAPSAASPAVAPGTAAPATAESAKEAKPAPAANPAGTTPASPDAAQPASPKNDTAAGASAPANPATAAAQPADAKNSATPATQPAPGAAAAQADPAKAATANTTVPTAESPDSASPLVAANNPAAAAADAPAAGTNAPQPGAIIPLIVMDDVPLTDAIKNLARQAGLNYMLDPKIGFGQVGPDGKVVPQPTVSIRWENITAEQALTALLNNHSLQLVEDPKSKIARITIKDPAAPDPLVSKTIQLKYANPSNIVAAVQTVLTDKRSKVVSDVRTSQLVVLATDKEFVEVEPLIEKLDTAPRQVLIEAKLMETSMKPNTIKGIDWSGTLQNQSLHFGNNLQHNSPDLSLNNTLSQTFPRLLFDTAKGFNPATAFLDADGVSAVVSFLNKYAEAKVLSSPRAVTLDNESATLSVTRATPIFKNTAGTQGSPGGSEVTYTNLGIILNVTPRISANNFVNLRIVPEVSRLFDVATKTVAGTVNQADIYDIRRIDTHVIIPSGNTLVLGGLVSDDVRNSNTKVPFLGDVPGLGHLFRTDQKSREKQNLLIFITPTIVGDDDFQPTTTAFLKSPIPAQDTVDGEWSAIDSGKPKDWSKPSQ